ncbi:MAG: transcription antitermination factor NusB [Candidatus Omnitrophota bacterium]|nr:transcription antitermination factor NusB [Candidatus Omnitrophota bacterium]
MRLRTKAREIALHVLYQIEIVKRDHKEALDGYLAYEPQQEEVIVFSRALVEGVIKNLDYIDSFIKKYVKNWDIDRMAVIDRNILRLASFELLLLDDVPPKVSINEAIELAKRFGDVDSSRFVNGVLDKIYRMERKKKGELSNDTAGEGSSV